MLQIAQHGRRRQLQLIVGVSSHPLDHALNAYDSAPWILRFVKKPGLTVTRLLEV